TDELEFFDAVHLEPDVVSVLDTVVASDKFADADLC
ncbi:hypothetical protein F441_07417, partial [Phytophthora nicotianae CJ01A1]